MMYMKELVADGYVGEMHGSPRQADARRRADPASHRTWQRDAELGANTLTIANGHTIDAMRFVTGDFARLSAVVATQAKQWLDTGSNTWLDVTAPDNILVSGRLANGAVVSSHIAAIPYAGSGYRMEIYGREGTLVAAGEDSPQLGEVTLHGAQRGNTLRAARGAGALHRRRARHARPARPPMSARCTRCSPRRSAAAGALSRISPPPSNCTAWSMRSSSPPTPVARCRSAKKNGALEAALRTRRRAHDRYQPTGFA